MPGCVIKAILLSTVVASMSFFISHTQLLKKFRDWLGQAGGARKPWQSYIGSMAFFLWQLITCSYCLGHWIAVAVLIIFPVRLFGVFWLADYVLTWLVISWLAGLQSLAASRLWGD